MTTELETWWNSFNKHWQKVILVNYDLYYNERMDVDSITNEIISKDEFNAYKINTGRGISDYFKKFKPNANKLKDIANIPNLTIQYSSLTDVEPLFGFKKLTSLTLKGFSMDSLLGFGEFKQLEKLTLIDCININSLEGINEMPALSEIELIYCYNLEDIKHVNLSNSIKTIDISNVGTIIDLNIELKNRTIKIHKSSIHPDDKYYNKKFNIQFKKYSDFIGEEQEYVFDADEVNMILNEGSEIQKNNYLRLFNEEKEIMIEIVDYFTWKIKRRRNQ